jgi:hypothetical protein
MIVRDQRWRQTYFLASVLIRQSHRRSLQQIVTATLQTPIRQGQIVGGMHLDVSTLEGYRTLVMVIDSKATPCDDRVIDVASTGCCTD